MFTHPNEQTGRAYNIAHLLPWVTLGGTELATRRIVQSLQSAGLQSAAFNHTAFCLSSATQVAAAFSEAGIATATWEPEEPAVRSWRGFLYRSWQLARELKRREIDLVHCSDSRAGNYAAFAAKLAGLPVLCHVRNRDHQIKRRDKRCLGAVDKFVFVSQDTWRQFDYPVPEQRGLVVYDGIDVPDAPPQDAELKPAILREFGLPPDVSLIGMAARLSSQKDYATLAKAAARVVAQRPDTRFLIIGDHSLVAEHSSHYAYVQQVLAAQGVAPYFTFTGFRTDVERLLRALDIFVLSTHYEGLPHAILEAMAQAKPVVATAVDGIPEVVSDGVTGLLYPHQDDAQLAAHLLTLLQQPARATDFGVKGRNLIESKFSKAQFTANIEKLYQQTLNTRPRELGNVPNVGLRALNSIAALSNLTRKEASVATSRNQ